MFWRPLRKNLLNRSGAVSIFFTFNAQSTQLGEPQVRQRGASLTVNVAAQFKRATSASGDDQRQVVVLVRGPIAHTCSEGEDGVVEQRGAIGFLYAVHTFEQSREGKDVESVEFKEMFQMSANGVGHTVMTIGLVQNTLPVGGRCPSLRSHHQGANIC